MQSVGLKVNESQRKFFNGAHSDDSDLNNACDNRPGPEDKFNLQFEESNCSDK